MVKAVITQIGTGLEKVLTFPLGTEPRDVLRHVRTTFPDWVFTEFKELPAA